MELKRYSGEKKNANYFDQGVFVINLLLTFSRLIRCDDAPVLTMMQKRLCSINNVKLFLGIIQKRTNQLITSIGATEQPSKILGKDRVPKFNVRESAKSGNTTAKP